MNMTPNSQRRGLKRPNNPLATNNTTAMSAEIVQQHFDALSGQGPIVEHLTVPGFLRLIDHRWSLGDVRRFGNELNHMAEALGLAYLTATDASLGILRMYPEPLHRRVYDNLAPQFGWPQIIDVETPQLEEAKKRRDALKANERQIKVLQQIADEAEDPEVLASVAKMHAWLESQAAALRQEGIEGEAK